MVECVDLSQVDVYLNRMPVTNQWNLDPLFKNDQDPAIATSQLEARHKIAKFVKTWKDTKYCQDSKVLLKALTGYEKLMAETGINGQAV